MNNIIILGAGRSGTSMTTGLFSEGNYFMGDKLNKPNETNPKGQFEDSHINQLNESLIEKVINSRPTGWTGKVFFSRRPGNSQMWLSVLKKPVDSVRLNDQQKQKIQYYASKSPYCYKDPRFSYSLPLWIPYLTNTKFIIVFRHPASTVNSMMLQKQRVAHLNGFNYNHKYLFKVYESMYNHILNVILPLFKVSDYLVIHYNQLFESTKLDQIEAFSEYKINRSFPDLALVKPGSIKHLVLPNSTIHLYDKLCALSGYTKTEK